MTTITVVKISGHELDQPAFVDRLVATLASMSGQVVLVHGGGKEITAAMEHYDQEVRFVEGLRVTPPESMAIMEMVVCGSINKRLVARLLASGRQALGLSGVDLGLLRCVPHRPGGVDLGRVGAVTTVDVAVSAVLLAQGWLPVLAPVALGQGDYMPYNVNADMVAMAVAAALARDATVATRTELVFVSNIPGVRMHGTVVPYLTASAIQAGIASGDIHSGMIPKVQSALAALEQGVTAVRITDLNQAVTGGTCITKDKDNGNTA